MKPKVLVDLERLKYINTGLGQFCRQLGSSLIASRPERWEPVFFLPARYKDMFEHRVALETVSIRRKFLPWTCKAYDLWHATHQDSPYYPSDLDTRYILTIHDLNFLGEKTPGTIRRRLKKLQRKVDRAQAVTVISEFTKKLVLENLTIPPGIPLYVIHNGASVPVFSKVRAPHWAPREKFLFAIGVVRPKKNFHVLVDFIKKLPGYHLVLAGNTDHPYARNILRRVQANGLRGRFHFVGEVSGEEKYWLYSNCEALVFPSKLEGFGLPVIEAMGLGKPVFLSTCASLPEIGGKEAYYWSSFDPDEMARVFVEGMDEYNADSSKSRRIKEHASHFTWENATRKYIGVYEKVLFS